MSEPAQTSPTPDELRSRLASERTLLSWVRTSLAMMALGFVVARFGVFPAELDAPEVQGGKPAPAVSLWVGTGLVLLGAGVNVLAAIQHIRFLRRLERGEPWVFPGLPLSIVVAFVLAAVGLGLTAHLVLAG